MFLKKNSQHNLLEVLSPRYEFDREKKKKKRTADSELSVRHPIFAGLSAIQLSDPQVSSDWLTKIILSSDW